MSSSDVFEKKQEKFIEARDIILNRRHENHGIGTLAEKSVHAVLKIYMEPDEDLHEVPIDGYVADIFTGEEVIEIQTGSFRPLRDKLNCFLNNYHVTVVHPIPVKRTLCWMDPETGEIVSKRTSNLHGVPQSIFDELYTIRPILDNPRLSIVVLMIDLEDIRFLDGYGKDKKKRATKYDKIPLRLIEELRFDRPEDYRMLIPPELESFTSAEFAKAVHINKYSGTTAMQILNELGVVKRVSKKGSAYVYDVIE
ncbi:MAG: hypothetical protein K5639_06270 [Eubacterium sp.]|nr:hypothetical protein [Eubacterium sp.]